MGYIYIYSQYRSVHMICILVPRNHKNQSKSPTLDNNALSIYSVLSVYTMHVELLDYDRDGINAGKGVGSGYLCYLVLYPPYECTYRGYYGLVDCYAASADISL